MELDRIYNEDCVEGLKRLPDGCVDLIITDPPYEFVGADATYGGRGAFGSVGRSYHGELDNAGLVGGFQREEIMRECPFFTEKAMAPHSSTLTLRIPWTKEPSRLQSMGLLRVGHD